MTQLQKWISLNRLYDESCPSWIRFKLLMDKNMIITAFYSLYIVSPPVIGILLLGHGDFYLWMLVVYIIYLQLLVFLNDRMLYPSFKNNDLMGLPLTKRARYLHYMRFKDLCEDSEVAKEQVKALLHWHKTMDTKMYTSKFIDSKKLLLSIFITLLLNYYQPQLLLQISSSKVLSVFLLTALVYLFIDSIIDLSIISKRREHKLCTFLYMYTKEEGD